MLRLRGIRQDRPDRLEAWSQTAPSLSSLSTISHSKRTDKRLSEMVRAAGLETARDRQLGFVIEIREQMAVEPGLDVRPAALDPHRIPRGRGLEPIAVRLVPSREERAG